MDLLDKMLTLDPSKVDLVARKRGPLRTDLRSRVCADLQRISAKEALEHDYFKREKPEMMKKSE